jgi:hypothetical protein
MDITPDADVEELVVLTEKDNARAVIADALIECVNDHFAGLEIIQRIGGYANALAYIRTRLPSYKKVRSGDLGELLATEYIDQCTDYNVPIKRLRWKDDRNTTMRGDDVIAVKRHGNTWKLLKAESKSRAALSAGVVGEAVTGLRKNSGRPNPSTLGFISARLREMNRDDEARVFERMQKAPPPAGRIEHLVFTLSGNDPTSHLKTHRASSGATIQRHLVGCVIDDHQRFIATLFRTAHAGND